MEVALGQKVREKYRCRQDGPDLYRPVIVGMYGPAVPVHEDKLRDRVRRVYRPDPDVACAQIVGKEYRKQAPHGACAELPQKERSVDDLVLAQDLHRRRDARRLFGDRARLGLFRLAAAHHERDKETCEEHRAAEREHDVDVAAKQFLQYSCAHRAGEPSERSKRDDAGEHEPASLGRLVRLCNERAGVHAGRDTCRYPDRKE